MDPGFAVVTCNRLDRLVAHLAAQLEAAPLPPLEHEVVVVQSRGMQRWLTLELARHHGLSASLTTPFPRPFCRYLLRQLSPHTRQPASESIPRQDASDFGREMLLWRLVELLSEISGAAVSASDRTLLAAPRAYLEDDGDQRKLFQLATRLAGLFDDYQLYRGDLLESWQAEEPAAAAGEAAGPELWQASLWRRLTAAAPDRAGEDEPMSRALRRLIDGLGRRGRAPEALPTRLAVLGVASLPPIFIELLVALGRFIPVTVYLVSPTYHYWGDLRSERESARLARRLGSRQVELSAWQDQHWEAGHPLLASLGKQGRELFELLQRADSAGAAWIELESELPSGDGALAVLQRDILHLVDRSHPTGEEQPLPLSPDDSLTLHICHSQMREMQVVRNQLLQAFDQLPELRPSDVLVQVPDMEQYGPYIQAVFGVAREDGVPLLPFSIADRGAGREQPPAEVMVRLLELADARLTLRQVFDLLETAAVRRAFGLGEDDLPTLRRLCADAGVRWSLSGEHKQRLFGVPAEGANTWRAGLDRLLTGYAVGRLEEVGGSAGDLAGGELVLGVSPAAGDTAGVAEILGRFAELVSRLEHRLTELRRRRTLPEWATVLSGLVDDFFLAEEEDEERGLQLVRDVAHQLAAAAERIGGKAELSLQVVREHLASALATDGFGSGFLNGQITFCALRPMRTIPFRVICICGLDAGVFPRRDRRPGFDLMARQPRIGDRSVRDDDRYLFLETLLAARDRLVLTHVGRSQQDGSERQPSAVVSELVEHLDRSFEPRDGLPASRHLTVVHPLQPWSDAYFDGRSSHLRSFATEDVKIAASLRDERQAEPPLVGAASDLRPAEHGSERQVTVEELIRFWQAPSRWFCQRALGVSLDTGEMEGEEAEPMVLRGLEGYGVRQWLTIRRLADREAGRPTDPEAECQLLRSRGELPPAALGEANLRAVGRRVDAFLRHIPSHRLLPPRPLDLRLDGDQAAGAGAGWRLGGVLDALTDGGLLRYRCAKLRPADWLRAWIEHLVYSLDLEPGSGADDKHDSPGACESWLIGEDSSIRLTAVRQPARILSDLLAGLARGESRPLPSFPVASFHYVEHLRTLADPRRRASRSPDEVARAAFSGTLRSPAGDVLPSEAADPWVRLAFRGLDPLDEPDFGPLAERLWRPIFDHLREEKR